PRRDRPLPAASAAARRRARPAGPLPGARPADAARGHPALERPPRRADPGGARRRRAAAGARGRQPPPGGSGVTSRARRAAAAAALAIAGAACADAGTATPRCEPGERLGIVAQSVPGAAYLPCVDELPPGWSVDAFAVDDGGTRFSL